jgi:catechol 2,3-dioxygenase-like lactoylglutathione lyase family enzyme
MPYALTIKRMDHVSVVVDDLPAAIAFFTTLGMAIEGETPVEGPGWTASTGSKASRSTSL